MTLSNIQFLAPDEALQVEEFLQLTQSVWPRTYEANRVRSALNKTINLTARKGNSLVGCVRLLTDGYFFATVTEILVAPTLQGQGIGNKLMELVWAFSPCTLSFGVQEGNEVFFEKLGYTKTLNFYQKRKSRNS